MSADNALCVSQIESNHMALLVMCDLLEGIADGLPDRADRQECLILSQALGPMVKRIHDYEEETLFPALLRWRPLHPAIGDTIARLRSEHERDAQYAEDVQDMLHSYAVGHPSLAADAAGFMLRGFFESMRRHIAFEQEMLVPLMRVARV
jgi:hemerythrin-like domain-containing protein